MIMGEHFNVLDDKDNVRSAGDAHPVLRLKVDRRQKSGTFPDRRDWPYHWMYFALLIAQAVLQIGLVLVRQS